jgi:RNA 3'-terminal phosphate cyclase (ATP)
LLPLALGNGGVYLTQPLSSHSRTNFEVIQKFLDVKISVTKLEAGKELVEVRV